jgi:predicted ATPase/DNA-binding XRE family transcriptional regulator
MRRQTSNTSFGQLLREIRSAACLTQEELAERAGLSPRGISDLERGARRSPQRATLRLLADALQLDGDERAMLAAAAGPSHDGARCASTRSRAARSLPETLTSFVGRTREQADIAQALQTHRLITLTGVAGIGKTRLAVAAARSAGTYQTGTPVMVELGSQSDPRLVPDQLAATLGVTVHPGITAVDALLAELADARLLIVLDNCEHLLAACSALDWALLGSCPGLRILATSRQPLGLACEVVLPVPCLTTSPPEEVSVHRLARYGAVQLFVDRARAVWPSFALSSANAAAEARVCRRLEGIPLAIELAAARTRVLTIDQIDSRLEDRYRLLSSGQADAPARHQTLRAAVEWSYELLSPRERLLLERLAVVRGGATLEAVEAVCGTDSAEIVDATDVLQALVEKSLVVANLEADGRIRFSQLETLREFGHARILQRGELDLLRARHLNYYMHLAEQAVPERRGGHQVEWLDRLEVEHDNVRAAVSWATGTDAALEDGLRLGRRDGSLLCGPRESR